MTRVSGFAVMDVSTSVCDDPKFRRIGRESPELLAPAFMAFIGVMAESWKVGRRVSIDHAWPSILPYDERTAAVLRRVGLLDRTGRLTPASWRETFGTSPRRIARERNTQPRGIEWEAICARFGHRCAYCGAAGVPLQVEHRKPLSRAGTSRRPNLVPACKPCNGRKATADPRDWPLAVVPS